MHYWQCGYPTSVCSLTAYLDLLVYLLSWDLLPICQCLCTCQHLCSSYCYLLWTLMLLVVQYCIALPTGMIALYYITGNAATGVICVSSWQSCSCCCLDLLWLVVCQISCSCCWCTHAIYYAGTVLNALYCICCSALLDTPCYWLAMCLYLLVSLCLCVCYWLVSGSVCQ